MFSFVKIYLLVRAMLPVAILGLLSLGVQAQSIADLFDAKTQKMLGSVGGAWVDAAQGKAGKAAPSGGAGQSAALDVLGALTPGANGQKSDYKYRYNPKTSVKVRNHLAKVIAEKLDNVSEKELDDNFKESNLVESVGAALESKGYTKHSLATAMAYFTVINLEIVYGTQFNDKQNGAMLRQTEQHMANTPEIGQLDDENKQFIAESLIWLATLQYMGHQNALKGAPGATDVQSTVQGARAALAHFQINPDDFRLTAEGLLPK